MISVGSICPAPGLTRSIGTRMIPEAPSRHGMAIHRIWRSCEPKLLQQGPWMVGREAKLLTIEASHSVGTTMTRANGVGGMTLGIGLVALAIALPRAQAGAPAANPTAALFTEQCSGCHGTDLAGGRAPSLFNEQWLASTSDERIANAIRNGVPNTAMVPFKSLSDQQIWQLSQ